LLAVVVRTKSTTGTPRRQMVTGSPSSAAFISWGSLFLAFATLTFIGSYYSHLDSYVNNRRVLTDMLQDIRSACVDSNPSFGMLESPIPGKSGAITVNLSARRGMIGPPTARAMAGRQIVKFESAYLCGFRGDCFGRGVCVAAQPAVTGDYIRRVGMSGRSAALECRDVIVMGKRW